MPLPPQVSNAGLGWIRDRPDQRDRLLAAAGPTEELPIRTNNRPNDVPRFDQGQLGSCTANATVGMYRYMLKKQGKKDFIGSRLFLYYNSRVREGTIKSDSGAMLRTSLKSVGYEGICSEASWPYRIEKFTRQPTKTAYKMGERHQALQYLRMPQNQRALKECLAAGYHFVFGFSVYESFYSDHTTRTGLVQMPQMNETNYGGHAVRAVDYDDELYGGVFIVANSWGNEWGDDGYFYMPYEFMLRGDLAGDFWTIREAE